MPEHFEIGIIGGGPGGISASVNAAKHGLSHVLFEKAEVADTIHQYQLRKHVMAEPDKLPLAGDVGFEAGTREDILDVWNKALEDNQVNVKRPVEVSKIEKATEGFKVFYGDDYCVCDSLVLGIGAMGSPRKLGVPGEDLPHVAYRLGDPDAFQDMDIIVVGAGDAAIENVLGLADKNRVSIVNRKGEFARAKDANCALIEEAIESGKVRCFYNATIAKVGSDQTVINTPEGESEVPCQHLIARLGSIPPRKFMEACGIEFPSPKPTDVPVVDSRYESNVKGLYLLGSLIGYPLIKQAINQGYEVIEHILGNEVEPADQVLIAETLADLPGEVNANMAMIREALPLFQGMSDPQFRELIVDSTIHLKKEGEIIFERNDYSNTLFSIVSGAVQVELENKDHFELGPEDFFGEIGLISGRRRTATTRAIASTVLLETPRKQMLKLISSVEPIKNKLDEIFMYRSLKGFFPDVSGEQLWKLVAGAKLQKFKKNQIVFKEGDEGEYFHVIRKGSVKVSRLINGEDVTQTYISVGNYFGETALIGYGEEGSTFAPQPRTATITAAVECDISAIEIKDFFRFLKDNPDEMEKLHRVAQKWRTEDKLRTSGQDSGDLFDFAFGLGTSDADNVLIINSDLCVGCDNCEKACAATHDGYSRLDRKGGESFASIQVPTSCRHCQNPLCMTDCPPDALMRKISGEVIIKDNCIGCGNCEKYCPYDVIQMVYAKPKSGGIFSFMASLFKSKDDEEPVKIAAKCDMCTNLSGGPACVRTCPTGAAMRVSPSKMQEIFANNQG